MVQGLTDVDDVDAVLLSESVGATATANLLTTLHPVGTALTYALSTVKVCAVVCLWSVFVC